MASSQEPVPQRATVTVSEAAKILGLSRAGCYEAVRTGSIPSLRLSKRRIVIAKVVIERLLSGEPRP